MEIRLKDSLGEVRVHLADAASQSEKRRLSVYKGRIRCKPACSGCCSRLLSVTMAEAVLMYDHLSRSGQWAEARKVCIEQIKMIPGAKHMTWFKMNQKCPVLDRATNLCRAYMVRPATCSTHFVTSDPSLCDPWSANGGKYESADFTDILNKFSKRMSESVRGNGIFTMTMPLPTALILAEQISVKSGLDLADVMSLFFKEL